MTIDRSQGQTFNTVGIYLLQHVFPHGQFYKALSMSNFAMTLENLKFPLSFERKPSQ